MGAQTPGMFAQLAQRACDQRSTDQFGIVGDQFGLRLVDERLGRVEDAEHGLDHALDIGIVTGRERPAGQRIHFLSRLRQRSLQFVHGWRERFDRRCLRQSKIAGGPKLAQPPTRGGVGQRLFAEDAIGRPAFRGNIVCRVYDLTEGDEFRKAAAIGIQRPVIARNEGEPERERASQYDNNGRDKAVVQSHMAWDDISILIKFTV
jgi:hypothetical protein